MALLPKSLDYTDKDFDAIKARIVATIQGDPGLFPDWTDFNIASFGNTIIEMFSFVLDVLAYYQNADANEAYGLTADQRKNLIALAKWIGFVPSGRRAATTDLQISLPNPPLDDVIFEADLIVRTKGADPVSFRLLSDAQINKEQDPPVAIVSVEHSIGHTQQFISSGLATQEITLNATPFVAIESIIAGNGIYTEVDNFLSSRSNDRHCVVIVDQNDRATIRFGNGTNGQIPVGTVVIDYKTGGGSEGNVAENTLTQLVGTFFDESGNPVFPTVTNPSRAGGGENRQSNESIRTQAPLSLRVLTRSVAREDFEIAAITKTSAARALMLTSDQDPSIAENTGFLFVVPAEGGLPSQELKDQVAAIFETRFEDGGLPKTITFKVQVRDPAYKAVNIFAVIYLASGFEAQAVRRSILSSLEKFFEIVDADGVPNETINFGFYLKNAQGLPAAELPLSVISDVITVGVRDDQGQLIQSTRGVRKIGDGTTDLLLNGEHRDVALALRDFPVLGTVTLINGETGDPL